MMGYKTLIDKLKALHLKHLKFWRLGTDYEEWTNILKGRNLPYEVKGFTVWYDVPSYSYFFQREYLRFNALGKLCHHFIDYSLEEPSHD